jgi:hypothetical protein
MQRGDGMVESGGNDERITRERITAAIAKRMYWETFRGDPNVVGAGFGRRTTEGQPTGEPALVVYVMRKVPAQFLPLSQLLPGRLYVGRDGIEVDVLETGPIYPLSFTARERPAPAGISIGNANTPSAGTLGCWVTDLTDGATCLLSNNHVIARDNAAAIGEAIVQPGRFDGGASPADDVAQLKRFVAITATGNRVDGAIAEANDLAVVLDQMKDDLMATPNSDHPAVGLLFAGSCNRTIMNPIRDVLTQLNLAFPAGAASDEADLGMHVEKVGRSTEYTTSTVAEIDVTVTIPYGFGSATFDGQFATAWMAEAGDSGSIVCRGGVGGTEDRCG